MLECPVCAGEVPEVLGAPEQRCPHCRAVLTPEGTVASPVDEEEEFATGADTGGADAAGALRSGFHLWLQNLGAFTGFWLVPALVMAATTLVGYAFGIGDPTAGTTTTKFYAVMLPLGLLDFIVSLYFVGGVAGMVAEARGRGYASLTGGYRVLAESGDRLFTVALVTGGLMLTAVLLLLLPITFLTLGEVGTGLGITLLLIVMVADIPGFLMIYWYLFATPLAALHPTWTPGRAFSESRAFARGHRTIGFTFTLFALLVAAVVVSFIVTRLLNRLVLFVGAEPIPAPLLEAGSAFLAALLCGVLPVLITVLYLDTRLAPASPQAENPGSPGRALQATAEPVQAPSKRRVRCPQCGTPIDYVSTGAPVTVTCPTCGRQGTLR